MTRRSLRTASGRGAPWREKASRFVADHRRGLVSALAFGVCGGAFAGLIAWFMGSARATAALQGAIASITSGVLNVLGNHTTVAGVTIQSPRFSLSVVTACTGLFLTAVFTAAVIAYPSRVVEKLLGAAVGAIAIFAMNIVRLVSLFYIGVYLPRFLEPAHLLVWQSLLIVSVLFLWLLWAGKVTHASCKR